MYTLWRELVPADGRRVIRRRALREPATAHNPAGTSPRGLSARISSPVNGQAARFAGHHGPSAGDVSSTVANFVNSGHEAQQRCRTLTPENVPAGTLLRAQTRVNI